MIKTDMFIYEQGKEGESKNEFAELHALNSLVDSFAIQMKKALQLKAQAGKTRWDDPDNKASLLKKLVSKANQGTDYIGMANLAAMLWNFEQPDNNQPKSTVILIAEYEANAIRKAEKRQHIVDDNNLKVNDIIKFQVVDQNNPQLTRMLFTKITHVEKPNGVAIRNCYHVFSIQFLYEVKENNLSQPEPR